MMIPRIQSSKCLGNGMDYSRLDRVCTYIFHPVPPFPWRPGLNDRVGHESWTLIQYINSTNRFLSLYRVDDSGIKLLLEHVITVASSSFLLDKNYSSPPTYRCSTDYWTGWLMDSDVIETDSCNALSEQSDYGNTRNPEVGGTKRRNRRQSES